MCCRILRDRRYRVSLSILKGERSCWLIWQIPSSGLPSMQAPAPRSSLAAEFSKLPYNPIVSAAESIIHALQEMEKILRKEGVLSTIQLRASATQSSPDPQTQPLKDLVDDRLLSRYRMSRSLKSISWTTRVKHDATPWRPSNKQELEKQLQNMTYWTRVLYDILPAEIKDSVLWQGISGYVLIDPESVRAIARLNQGVMSQQAQLRAIYE